MAMRKDNVTDINEKKKKHLNDRQQAFIEIARRIRASEPMPSLDEINTLSGNYPIIAKALREARIDGNEDDFTTAYDVMSNEHTNLKDWRSLIGVPGSEEEADRRFKIGKTGKKVIVRFTEDDIDALPDKEDLIKDILEKGTVSMIYGHAGTGKTFNALHIAYCIANGVNWFGHEVKQGKVWYINTEGGRGLKPRIRAWRKEYRRDKTSNIEFITWPVHLKEHSQE